MAKKQPSLVDIRKKKPPQLVEIDLSKQEDCEHPDINAISRYLAKIDGTYYAGTFSKVWYGWNFDAGFQLDYDGWQRLWEIVE